MLVKHKHIIGKAIHQPNTFTYANKTARMADNSLEAEDIGCLALQIDTGSYWRLSSISPIAWEPTYGNTMFQRLQAEEVTGIEYNASNKVTKTTYGNGIYCTVGYNVSNKVESIKFYNSSDLLIEEWSYTYDAQGRLITVNQLT